MQEEKRVLLVQIIYPKKDFISLMSNNVQQKCTFFFPEKNLAQFSSVPRVFAIFAKYSIISNVKVHLFTLFIE